MRKQAFIFGKAGTISILFSLFLMLAATSAFAQDERVKANIPFDFIAGKKLLPAGEYTISSGMAEQPDLLLVRSEDGRHSTFLIANNTTARMTPKETDLVFNKVGDEYFLSQIWVAGEGAGLEIPKPRAERNLENRLARNGQSINEIVSQVRVPLQ